MLGRLGGQPLAQPRTPAARPPTKAEGGRGEAWRGGTGAAWRVGEGRQHRVVCVPHGGMLSSTHTPCSRRASHLGCGNASLPRRSPSSTGRCPGSSTSGCPTQLPTQRSGLPRRRVETKGPPCQEWPARPAVGTHHHCPRERPPSLPSLPPSLPPPFPPPFPPSAPRCASRWHSSAQGGMGRRVRERSGGGGGGWHR